MKTRIHKEDELDPKELKRRAHDSWMNNSDTCSNCRNAKDINFDYQYLCEAHKQSVIVAHNFSCKKLDKRNK